MMSLLALLSLLHIFASASCACPSSLWERRLDIDFETFVQGIQRHAVDRAEARTHGGYRVLLQNNTLYAVPLGWETRDEVRGRGPHELFGLLQRALCAHAMPDVEFVLNIYDRRAVTVDDDPVPLLSWSKDTYPLADDLLYPYWQLAYVNETVAGLHVDDHPWHTRHDRAFFRGATTGGVFKPVNWRSMLRVRLVRSCKKHPALCDAGITNYVQIYGGVEDAMRRELGSWAKTRHDQVSKYKYNVVLDGNAAPSQRLAVMLQSGSTLLRQETPSTEFYYDDLQPYVHYVPLSFHASDVLHKVSWCRKHDAAAKRIADAARDYAHTALTDANIACYWYRLLTRYAELQRFQPTLNATYAAHRVRLGNMDALREAGYACPHYDE